MDDVPAGVPSRAHEIVVTCIVCSILSAIFVFTRIYTRCFINRCLGWDDYIALITLPFCIVYGVCIGIATQHGMGLHETEFTPALTEQYYLWIGIASEFYVLSLMGYKVAILLLYLRIYSINRVFRWCVYVAMFIVVGYLFCNLITEFLGCDPPQKEWKSDLPGHCIDGIKADYAYGALHSGSDLILFVLPIPMIWMTQLKMREKIGIMIIFMFGSLNWIVAIVRFVFAIQDLTDKDRTWLAAKTFLLSIIEVNTGLICACVPVLKPFYKTIVAKTQSLSEWSLTISVTRNKNHSDGKSSMDDQTTCASETALTDLESQKATMASMTGSHGYSRDGYPVSSKKDRDLDNGKYGFGEGDI